MPDVDLFPKTLNRAEFTASQQKCISTKMSEMSGEDRPQDQKVAIAISKCTETAQRADRFGLPTPPWGKFKAQKLPNGNYNILGLPLGYISPHACRHPEQRP